MDFAYFVGANGCIGALAKTALGPKQTYQNSKMAATRKAKDVAPPSNSAAPRLKSLRTSRTIFSIHQTLWPIPTSTALSKETSKISMFIVEVRRAVECCPCATGN